MKINNVNTCAVCGIAIEGRGETCGSTCRGVIWRQRKRQKKLMEKFSFDLFQRARYQRIMDYNQRSAETIRRLLEDHGKDVADLAMIAVEQALFLNPDYGKKK